MRFSLLVWQAFGVLAVASVVAVNVYALRREMGTWILYAFLVVGGIILAVDLASKHAERTHGRASIANTRRTSPRKS